MTKKNKKSEKVDIDLERDRLNILIEGLAENTSTLAPAIVSTEIFQGLMWYWLTQTDTKLGASMSQAGSAILLGEVIPGVDLPKGAVLGALIQKGHIGLNSVESSIVDATKDTIDKIEDAVDDITEVKDAIEGGWHAYLHNEFTAAQCRAYDQLKPGVNYTIRDEGVWKLNVTSSESPYGAGHPRYTSWIDTEQRFTDQPNPCNLRDNNTMKSKIIGRIVDDDTTGPD